MNRNEQQRPRQVNIGRCLPSHQPCIADSKGIFLIVARSQTRLFSCKHTEAKQCRSITHYDWRTTYMGLIGLSGHTLKQRGVSQ